MKIYTKRGDDGETDVIGNSQKISKSSLRVSSYGDIDELNSFIGLTRNKLLNNNVCDDLKHINESVITAFAEVQNILFQIGTELATVDNKSLNYEINSKNVHDIEQIIDLMQSKLSPLQNFIIPYGDNEIVCLLHVCRSICRRAERSIVSLHEAEQINTSILQYINRMSDMFFVMARLYNIDCESGLSKDELWKK
ncbi:MAG: cob(I)yrinic acid a,c-diamide adenosyltransferase [Thermoproteota archaeon]